MGETVTTVLRPRSAWTRTRVAWLGFLVGLGWTAKKIAEDPLIDASPDAVQQAAFRFGLSLMAAPRGRVSLELPLATLVVIDRAAAQTHLQRDRFIERLLIRAAKEPERFGLVVVSS